MIHSVTIKTAIFHLTEVFFSLVLVVFSFLFYLYFLQSIFPQATSLGQYILEANLGFHDEPRNNKPGLFVGSENKSIKLDAPHKLVAIISNTVNRTKYKKANALDWKPAKNGIALYDRDAVQTLNRSRAVIIFDNDNKIDLGENSLIIIKEFAMDRMLQSKRSSLLMLSGEFHGSLEKSMKNFYLELVTPGGIAKINRTNKNDEFKYKVSINSNKSSTITMYKGKADIYSRGKIITLSPNHAINIAKNSSPGNPIQLPDPVIPIGPVNNNVAYYNNKKPTLKFNWKPRLHATEYHFELANDKAFRSVLINKYTSKTQYANSNLSSGTYFWKVSARHNKFEGAFSETRTIKIVKDTKPPEIFVKFPADRITSKSSVISGKVQGAIELFINSKSVHIGRSGSFEHILGFKRGVNVIIVEAVDKAGNVNYQSKIVKRH